VLTVTDEAGGVVRRITGPVSGGFHRVAWDLRYPAANPTSLAKAGDLAPWDRAPSGPLAAPGEAGRPVAMGLRAAPGAKAG
jgi:hypothetical protein